MTVYSVEPHTHCSPVGTTCDSGIELSRGEKRGHFPRETNPQVPRVIPWGEARISWG